MRKLIRIQSKIKTTSAEKKFRSKKL